MVDHLQQEDRTAEEITAKLRGPAHRRQHRQAAGVAAAVGRQGLAFLDPLGASSTHRKAKLERSGGDAQQSLQSRWTP
jgi:hypothetical protein